MSSPRYLHDLIIRIGHSSPTISWLYSKDHRLTCLLAYLFAYEFLLQNSSWEAVQSMRCLW